MAADWRKKCVGAGRMPKWCTQRDTRATRSCITDWSILELTSCPSHLRLKPWAANSAKYSDPRRRQQSRRYRIGCEHSFELVRVRGLLPEPRRPLLMTKHCSLDSEIHTGSYRLR